MSDPRLIKADDVVAVCPNPACKSDRPARPVNARLRNVVKHKGRFIEVISGGEMQCVECGTLWAFGYLGGIFWHRTAQTPQIAPNATSTANPLPPPKTNATQWIPLTRSAGV